MANPNHYEILGVSARATAKEIKDAYRALARQYHPDLNPQNSESGDNFRKINEAYRVLADIEQRSHYDYMNFEPSNTNKNTNTSSRSATQAAEVYYSQGLKKAQVRNYIEAIKDYSQAIAINSNYADAYNKRGLCYYKLFEPSEAIKDFTKALYLNSNIPDAYYNRGMAKFDMGYPQAAVEDYTQALKLKYNYGQAYYGRGLSYADLNNKKAAISDLQRAAQIFAQQRDNFNYKLAVEEIRRESRNFGIGNLFADICVCLTSPLLNPIGGMRSAYARLSRNNAIAVGIIFAIIFDFCFAFGSYISILQLANYVKVSFSILLAIGAIAWLSFAISAFLVRHIFQGKGNWIGDLFVVGAGLLPVGYLSLIVALMVFLEVNNIFILTGLVVFGACYFVLILYSGCYQILRISEAIATLAVPTLILLCASLMAFAVPPLISLGFSIP